MHDVQPKTCETKPSLRCASVIALVLIIGVGAYVRFSTLGERSLWADEFATWHVSQMPLGESLKWQPELTKPPLYQLCLRLLTDEARPPEWMLRLPAAIAGVLSVLVAYLLGRMISGRMTGFALAMMLAVNLLQIQYSQEARPYSLLVLGTMLSTWTFLLMLRRPSLWRSTIYAVVSALSFHAHYLTLLTIMAHAMWWVVVKLLGGRSTRPGVFVFGWSLLGALCTPMTLHFLRTSQSATQGLDWIEPISWSSSMDVMASLTFGSSWVWPVLVPALIIYIVLCFQHVRACGWNKQAALLHMHATSRDHLSPQAHEVLNDDTRAEGPRGLKPSAHFDKEIDAWFHEGFIFIWLAVSFLGLVVMSVLGQPAMLDRYALPAAVPAILGPLMIARRFHRNAPVILAALFVVGTLPDLITLPWRIEPGFRELAASVQENVDPDTDQVALVIDNTTFPGWEDAERLPLMYYPIEGHHIREVRLDGRGHPINDDLFKGEGHVYVILFRSDPHSIAEDVGVKIVPIELNGSWYDQLLFSPYRLAKLSRE